MRNSIYSIKFLLLALVALALAGCSAAPASTDDATETLGEVSEALCASYPTSGAGDGDGTGNPGGGWTGFVTQLRVSPAYDSMIEVTQTKSAGGATVVGNLNFGASPVGPANIKFIRAKSPGWTGSLTNKLVNLNRCLAGLPPSQSGCGGNVCNEPNGYACLFANNSLAFTWDTLNSPTNPGGTITHNSTSFPLGVTGIWGTAPAEPSHFRIFALSAGGPASYSSRWTFSNGVTCP